MNVWPYPFHKNQNPLAIPPGFLRTEIDIQRPPAGTDALGSQSEVWVSVLKALAGVKYVNSSERFDHVEHVSVSTHRISLWWPGDIGVVEGWRVIANGKTFVVQFPEDVQERHIVLHLYCTQLNGAN